MSPRRSRICSIEDCGRRHHAKGFCRRHYGEEARKAKQRERSSSHRSYLTYTLSGGLISSPVRMTMGSSASTYIYDPDTKAWTENPGEAAV